MTVNKSSAVNGSRGSDGGVVDSWIETRKEDVKLKVCVSVFVVDYLENGHTHSDNQKAAFQLSNSCRIWNLTPVQSDYTTY